LNPRTLDDFKNSIKEFRNFSDIIGVESSEKNVQIQAAKDSRVDLISFSEPSNLRVISPGIISLTKQNNSYIEFSISPIMTQNRANQSKFLRSLYRGLHMALNLKGNIILSGNFQQNFDLRNPRALISICTTLLGISLNKSKELFRENVHGLLKRVENRNNRNLIEPGVKIIGDV
jgi:RNase P/RNase MRP subunit p30